MEPKRLENITRISIIVLFVILLGILFYSLFYYKEINCNAKLEFEKIENCSIECSTNCVIQGFPLNLEHGFIGEKVYVTNAGGEILTNTKCLCECQGCRD